MDEEAILKALTNGDTKLESLDDLSRVGKNFLYACVHLLEKPKGELHQHKNTFNTFKILEKKNISVNRNEVLSNFVDTGGSLINNKKKRVLSAITNHIESNLNVQNKKIKLEEEDWLRAYKSQCKSGVHKLVEMAQMIGMNFETFKSKISRLKKSKVIEIPYSGSLNCEFCLKIQLKEAEKEGSDPFVTPKRNASIKKNKKPRVEEEEWLTAYKSQCKLGEHNNIEMAKLIGMNVDTFRGKIARERKRNGVIEIAYNGPLNCQFCLKIQSLEPEDRESIPTPKRKNGLITEEIMAKVATSCSKHTRLDMANLYGIKRNTLNQKINRYNLLF